MVSYLSGELVVGSPGFDEIHDREGAPAKLLQDHELVVCQVWGQLNLFQEFLQPVSTIGGRGREGERERERSEGDHLM